MDNLPINLPSQIKGYSFGKLLGQGAFADCFEVTYVKGPFRHVFACRRIRKSGQERQRRVVQAEWDLQGSLRHQNVVHLHRTFTDTVHFYQILEICTLGSLDELRLKQSDGRFTQEVCVFLFQQILRGVAYLHDSGIVHRDLKPQNIYLTSQQIVKIGDFGTAKIVEGDRLYDSKIGTPTFMAPEVVCVTGKGYSFPVDMWSLGCMLFEFLVGTSPFAVSDRVVDVYYAVLLGEYTVPATISPLMKHYIEQMLRMRDTARVSAQDLLHQRCFRRQCLPFCPTFMPELYCVKTLNEDTLRQKCKVDLINLVAALRWKLSTTSVCAVSNNDCPRKFGQADYVVHFNYNLKGRGLQDVFYYRMASNVWGAIYPNTVYLLFVPGKKRRIFSIIGNRVYRFSHHTVPEMLSPLLDGIDLEEIPEDDPPPHATFVVAWCQTQDQKLVFLLSNGTLQVTDISSGDILLCTLEAIFWINPAQSKQYLYKFTFEEFEQYDAERQGMIYGWMLKTFELCILLVEDLMKNCKAGSLILAEHRKGFEYISNFFKNLPVLQ